ncbi:cache domain-containing protein [Bauldia sp.]|uniref:cache domain-containing protein n=1 Tax=Bauldia sp. TaxID=2575872 RepID=UPI003BABC51F
MRASLTAVAALVIGAAPAAAADNNHATPQEIIDKVHEAAAYLADVGDVGLPTFAEANSPFVWKDTYVFVLDCSADLTVSHPVNSNIGRPVSTLKDVNGKPFGKLMCEAAANPDGGWVEYMWPRPVEDKSDDALEEASTPSRKVTYVMTVPDRPYQVGAGDYDDTLTVDQLDKLLTE